MPIIFKNEDSKIGFQLGQRSAHRSTNELVEQLLVGALLELSQRKSRLANSDTRWPNANGRKLFGRLVGDLEVIQKYKPSRGPSAAWNFALRLHQELDLNQA
jgi:hypothetical protein